MRPLVPFHYFGFSCVGFRVAFGGARHELPDAYHVWCAEMGEPFLVDGVYVLYGLTLSLVSGL